MKYRVWNVRRFMKENQVVLLGNGNLLFLIEGTDDEYAKMDYLDARVTFSSGLEDKNGTEIFEGDIVDVNAVLGHGRNRRIFFRNGGFGFEAVPNVSEELGYLEVWTKDVVVIGNIYENADLLKA